MDFRVEAVVWGEGECVKRPPKPPPSREAFKIARSVIRLVTNYPNLQRGWAWFTPNNRERITRLAARRVEKLLAKGSP